VLRSTIEGVRVESAGTGALVDHPVAPAMQRILRGKGIDTAGFRARRLDRSILDGADLVVTAEREHRAFVSRLSPEHAAKSFTLRQLARLLQVAPTEASDGSPVSRVLERAQRARGLGGPASAEDDIEDPWGRRAGVYRRTATQLDAGLEHLLRALSG
jgi:protein-tyrosine phosphatase